jgi:hypothetical protein
LEAKLLSRLNIGSVVVDERDLRGVKPVLPHEETEDFWVGLDKAHVARDEDSPKPLEKGKETASSRERLGAPVRQSVKRNLALTKLAKKLNGVPDGKHHLGEAVPPRLDEHGLVGESSDEFGDALVERPPGILLGVPLGSAHRREKLLDCRFRGQHLPVEKARIPMDEDAAEIKNCCFAGCHRCAAFYVGSAVNPQ